MSSRVGSRPERREVDVARRFGGGAGGDVGAAAAGAAVGAGAGREPVARTRAPGRRRGWQRGASRGTPPRTTYRTRIARSRSTSCHADNRCVEGAAARRCRCGSDTYRRTSRRSPAQSAELVHVLPRPTNSRQYGCGSQVAHVYASPQPVSSVQVFVQVEPATPDAQYAYAGFVQSLPLSHGSPRPADPRTHAIAILRRAGCAATSTGDHYLVGRARLTAETDDDALSAHDTLRASCCRSCAAARSFAS